jgi:regulator of replication initiation timing
LKTKKTVLIFLLVSIAAFQSFAQTGGDGNAGGKDGQTPVAGGSPQGVDTALQDIQGKIDILLDGIYQLQSQVKTLDRRVNDLQDQVRSLNSSVNDLQAELKEFKSSLGTRSDPFYDTTPKTDAQPYQTNNLYNEPAEQPEARRNIEFFRILIMTVLIVLFAVILVALMYCLIKYSNQRRSSNRSRSYSGKKPGRPPPEGFSDTDSSPNKQSSAPNTAPSKPSTLSSPLRNGFQSASPSSRTTGNAGTLSDSFTQRSATPQHAAPKPPVDEISPLYHSREKRDKRHKSDPGDIFLDVSKSVFERMVQGEKVQLAFEKGGVRLSARFVLVNNRLLYPNFHVYNEAKVLSKDNEKVLSMIYKLEGGLPGHIGSCHPATVSPGDGFFVVSRIGSLEIN